jgi:hypothetical protein
MSFPDAEALHERARSPDYQQISCDRRAGSDGVTLLVEGISRDESPSATIRAAWPPGRFTAAPAPRRGVLACGRERGRPGILSSGQDSRTSLLPGERRIEGGPT